MRPVGGGCAVVVRGRRIDEPEVEVGGARVSPQAVW